MKNYYHFYIVIHFTMESDHCSGSNMLTAYIATNFNTSPPVL
ncbi:hypothetical protein FHW36_105175 [Chitinophaga polysaccharea]|uniref:Uncharacterized protein n=1 Tax=Chitinophaga polysaccharea TaxID=1293035 RepID=A0A561PNP8_9BACT|nr:hypothetical protein FHW36_105175 [Chitinophaga polysaccharea]